MEDEPQNGDAGGSGGPTQSATTGGWARAAAFAIFVLIIICTEAIRRATFGHSPLAGLIGLAVAYSLAQFVFGPLMQRLIILSRRHRAPSWHPEPSGLPTVVYLRSFAIDSVTDRARSAGLLAYTDEEQVQRAFAPIGRMVATGRPGDRLPPAGATRIYMRDHDWQDQVTALVEEAELVLLGAGPGMGIRWEIELLVRSFPAERLVILIPFGPAGYRDFRDQVAGLFPRSLPADFAGSPGAARSIQGAIYFDADWTPQLADFDGDPRHSLTLECLRTLQPVFARCGNTKAETRYVSGLRRGRVVRAFAGIVVVAALVVTVAVQVTLNMAHP